MNEQRRSGHTVTRFTAHLVWVTKYRYPVLVGDIQLRCRELIIQICDTEDVQILKGVVSKDHVHIHIEYPSKLSISNLVKRLKGRTSRLLQQEHPSLKKRYLGSPFLGDRIWRLVDRKYNRRDGSRVSRASSHIFKQRQWQYDS